MMLWCQYLLLIQVFIFTFSEYSCWLSNKTPPATYIVDRYLYAANLSCLADPYVKACYSLPFKADILILP